MNSRRFAAICALLAALVGPMLTAVPASASTSPRIAVGPGPGGGPNLRMFGMDGSGPNVNNYAFDPWFTGGFFVALGDISNDGYDEYVVGAGPGGGPNVRVFSALFPGIMTHSFYAYDAGWRGGVTVATADINGDGADDVITGVGPGGGPHVKVFSGADGTVLASFFAYGGGFQGGVFVAAGDVNGDGTDDIITGAGAGGGPHVKVFDGTNVSNVLRSFFAYDAGWTGGVHVGAGDISGDGVDDVITGPGPGGGPHVRVFRSGDPGVVIHNLFVYDPWFTGGVWVAAQDKDSDAKDELIVGAGPGGGPHVRVLNLNSTPVTTMASFFAYEGGFSGGVRVAGGEN